jgi:hypothetical protein
MQTSLQVDSGSVRDLDRVRFVSDNFRDLQGLRTVWFGLVAVLLRATDPIAAYLVRMDPAHRHLYSSFEPALVLSTVIASYFAFTLVGAWYRNNFAVSPSKRITLSWLELVTLTFGIIGCLRLPTGQWFYLVAGLSWFVVGLWRPQRDRLVLGLGLLALGAFQHFLPPIVGSSSTSLILCGATSLVAGLLDHRLLVSTLGPAQVSPAEVEGAEAAGVQP